MDEFASHAAADRPPPAELLERWHRNEGGRNWIHPLFTLSHIVLMVVAVKTWNAGWWSATVACWCICAHLGHSKLIAFHEASHGTLNPRRWVNELQGILLGSTIFVPLSSYRLVHGRHHSYIATEHDLELWPFVNPGTSLLARWGAVVGELVFGFFYTPFLFLHGVAVAERVPKHLRRRIAWEYVFCAVVWSIVLAVLYRNHWWRPFAIGYFVQALLAGNLQSLRKFTEHLGLLGGSTLTTTRTVVDRTWFGRFLSESMLHIDYHGTHHRYARVPHYHLPEATKYVYGEHTPCVPIYSTYFAAVFDMLRTLGNPRVGAQWLRSTSTSTA